MMDMEEPPNLVRRGNCVYFHCDCTERSLLQLRLHLLDIRDGILSGSNMKKDEDFAIIDINSGGGEPHDLYSFIKTLGIPVITFVSGICASAATLIFLGGTCRIMSATSLFMIHSARGMPDVLVLKEGSSAEEAEKFKKLNDTMLRKVYKKETKIPAKLLNDMLSHREILLDAEECLTYKIIDSIGCNNGMLKGGRA
jgi:ATP-dependent protease ClpP protease subunit